MAKAITATEGGATDEDKQESLLEAVASTDIINDDDDDDVENQKSQVLVGEEEEDDEPSSDIDSDTPAATDIPSNNPTKQSTLAVTNSNVGILANNNDEEDDTASVFSFDSYEKQPRIPLRLQHMLNQQNRSNGNDNNGEGGGDGDNVPFPSVMGASLEYYDPVVNVCPCRCLFFTLKETLCLIMSALGCAVFLAGLVLLCMYLEGSVLS